MAESKRVKILLFSAAPRNGRVLATERYYRAADAELRQSEGRDAVELKIAPAVRPADLVSLVLRHRPDILHFVGHGTEEGEIVLVGQDGRGTPVDVKAVGRLCGAMENPPLRCVVLTACYSMKRAEELLPFVDCVVGIHGVLHIETAILYAAAFHAALGAGKSVEKAVELARVNASLNNRSDAEKIQCITRPGVNASDIRFLP